MTVKLYPRRFKHNSLPWNNGRTDIVEVREPGGQIFHRTIATGEWSLWGARELLADEMIQKGAWLEIPQDEAPKQQAKKDREMLLRSIARSLRDERDQLKARLAKYEEGEASRE